MEGWNPHQLKNRERPPRPFYTQVDAGEECTASAHRAGADDESKELAECRIKRQNRVDPVFVGADLDSLRRQVPSERRNIL